MGGIFGSLLGSLFGGSTQRLTPAKPLPPMVEDEDVYGQEQYTKKLLQDRGGRQSTVLGSRPASGPKMGSKTVLG